MRCVLATSASRRRRGVNRQRALLQRLDLGIAKGVAAGLVQDQLSVGGRNVVFRLINSAWQSRMHESRSLTLPVSFLAPKFVATPAPDLVVTAFHHPYNWFEPTNGKDLRKLLEAQSDLIITGHEHSADTYTKTGLSGEQNDYIEGGVLQENDDLRWTPFFGQKTALP